MSELGEGVALAVLPPDGPCPFCDEPKQPSKEKKVYSEHTSEDVGNPDAADDGDYTLHNDSGELAENLGSAPFRPITNPLAYKTFYIWEDFWIDENESKVCGNAHHVIPGNASFAKCSALLEWLSGTVKIKKVRYSKQKGKPQLGSETITDKEGARVTRVLSLTPSGTLKEEIIKEVPGKVTGSVDYNLNGGYNGVWLPSNNAIYNWKGTDKDFKKDYANAAMNAAKPQRQFHDAHPDYSNQVIQELGEIAKAIEMKAQTCIADPNHTANKDGSLPAPQRLRICLVRLAYEIKRLSVGEPSAWGKPWITSQLALRWEPQKP